MGFGFGYFLVYFSIIGENIYFTMTARVAGSTHSVLLAMNVILVRECEESNSSTS